MNVARSFECIAEYRAESQIIVHETVENTFLRLVSIRMAPSQLLTHFSVSSNIS
jgi:hypothetical protein